MKELTEEPIPDMGIITLDLWCDIDRQEQLYVDWVWLTLFVDHPQPGLFILLI